MANFSCGYYMPHTDKEYVVIDELILTSILFRDLIDVLYEDGKKWEIYGRDFGGYTGYGGYNYSGFGSGGTPTHRDSFNSVVEDDSDISSTKRIHSGSVDPEHGHDSYCSYCGQITLYDSSMDMNFCNNCMDYDYNSHGKW